MSTETASHETSGSVRMGPATLISLVVILCLAVLAVLALNTARASNAEAQRQQQFATSSYSNEFAAQRYLSEVDLALSEAKKAKAGKSATVAAVQKASPDAANIDEDTVRIAFATQSGRRLTVELKINDDYTYTVTQWTASTDWIDEDGGSGNPTSIDELPAD